MSKFTVSIDAGDGRPPEVWVRDYAGTEAARLEAETLIIAKAASSVSVGLGEGDEIEWLGSWDLVDGKPQWTPAE